MADDQPMATGLDRFDSSDLDHHLALASHEPVLPRDRGAERLLSTRVPRIECGTRDEDIQPRTMDCFVGAHCRRARRHHRVAGDFSSPGASRGPGNDCCRSAAGAIARLVYRRGFPAGANVEIKSRSESALGKPRERGLHSGMARAEVIVGHAFRFQRQSGSAVFWILAPEAAFSRCKKSGRSAARTTKSAAWPALRGNTSRNSSPPSRIRAGRAATRRECRKSSHAP